MDTSKIKTVVFVAAIFLCAAVAPVSADWNEGDRYKMHYPQLPDPIGVDVIGILADDWNCTENGYVTDIHIWGSWDRNADAVTFQVFRLEIWDDNTSGPYNKPGTLLWQRNFSECGVDFFVRRNYSGLQALYNPQNGEIYPDNHNMTYQYNFYIDPSDAFVQEKGKNYWLVVVPGFHTGTPQATFGVKNSASVPYGGTAVFWNNTLADWSELIHLDGRTLDLAFVITGEPQPSQVPQPSPISALTPTGIIALVSLLSAIAAVAIVRKRR
jgi:hypothetical protein